MIFAAAPSQNDVLKSLTEYTDIPWNRINACHMDEYVGLDKSAPQGFGNFINSDANLPRSMSKNGLPLDFINSANAAWRS